MVNMLVPVCESWSKGGKIIIVLFTEWSPRMSVEARPFRESRAGRVCRLINEPATREKRPCRNGHIQFIIRLCAERRSFRSVS